VEQELLPCGRRVVLLVTPDGLYVAVGGPGLQEVFSRCGPVLVCSVLSGRFAFSVC
jgi:hypothetical protein